MTESLIAIEPAEVAGRDTIARFNAQFRAAGFMCLQILHGKEIDRVYCDYHDDFVVRKFIDGKIFFCFFQVKTKGKRNHQWTLLEVFGIKKRGQKSDEESLARIKGSFVGKMLAHSINFKDSCLGVTFLTNVHFEDLIEKILEDLSSEDITNPNLKFLQEHFQKTFEEVCTEAQATAHLKKLSMTPNLAYLNPEAEEFNALAREEIHKYSEVDLKHDEIAQILTDLVALVERKSFPKIEGVSEAELDDKAGIGIFDLLEIMSISREGYLLLVRSGDEKAVKNASIIQRKLRDAGATEEMIEYCTQQKVDWDVWVRDKRHSIPEFDFNFLLTDISAIQRAWAHHNESFDQLRQKIDNLYTRLDAGLKAVLTKDLLLGGIFSALVRETS